MNGSRGTGTRIRIARDALSVCAAALVLGATGCAHGDAAGRSTPAATAAGLASPRKKFAKVVYVEIDDKGCPAPSPSFDFDDGTEEPPAAK
jgi:hypothetical protein